MISIMYVSTCRLLLTFLKWLTLNKHETNAIIMKKNPLGFHGSLWIEQISADEVNSDGQAICIIKAIRSK